MSDIVSIPPVNPNDPGRGPMIVGLLWAFTIIAVLAVALRIYIRQRVSKYCAPEDWIMLVAVVSKAHRHNWGISYSNNSPFSHG